MGGLAEFERELIRLRTGEGRRRAKARGTYMGRPPKLTPHQRREASEQRFSQNFKRSSLRLGLRRVLLLTLSEPDLMRLAGTIEAEIQRTGAYAAGGRGAGLNLKAGALTLRVLIRREPMAWNT